MARGVTPYLPLNLEPEMEAQVERVLILAGKPVMRRPIAAATVLDALPAACAIDQVLCERVERYLARYTHPAALTHASLEVASTHGANKPLPDRYGLPNGSASDASLSGYVQPSDYLLINIGGVAYDGRQSFTGTYLSAGFSKLQLDIGYKPHWFSPLSDSSMLMSTEAPTMPSVSLSNYEPLTRLGLTYEVFDARMSYSNDIVYTAAPGGITRGYPHLGGIQITMEPASGWSLGLNRLVQFGGGARGGGSLTDLLRAIVNPSKYSNLNPNLSIDQKAANQEASVTTSLIVPARVPFVVYAEYAGEDTSHGRNYLLGDTGLSWGIHFPRLPGGLDFTFEASEWQDNWYTHPIWQDGMTNYGLVVSNWFGDQRVFNDAVGGRSAMARLAWDASFGGRLELRYRTLQNQNYAVPPFGVMNYQRYHEFTLGYSRPWHGVVVGGEFDSGRDVFGASFSRLAGFVRYDDAGAYLGGALHDIDAAAEAPAHTEVFVESGASSFRTKVDLTELTAITDLPRSSAAHFAVGARRFVTDHSDLGARVESDEAAGHNLLGVRLIDYRYRFEVPLALTAFLGAARYDLATPAYGFYYGAGVQWRDILPHIDLGAEARYYDNLARDRLLASDPHTNRRDSFYDIWGGVLSLSYHF
ncbi:MAG TPA: capsule assembly Wzi family protein [Steroidobacteraceae bacterium]